MSKNSIMSEPKQLQFPFSHGLKTFFCVFETRRRLTKGKAAIVLTYLLVLYPRVT